MVPIWILPIVFVITWWAATHFWYKVNKKNLIELKKCYRYE